MSLTDFFSTPIRIRSRTLAIIASFVLAIVLVVGWAGSRLPRPSFVISTDGGSITPVDYPTWRIAADWLVGRKYATLTFDDGPYGHGVDEQILRILHRHHAYAIFFTVCRNIDAHTRHVLEDDRRAGDLIGNHSYDHPHLPKLSATQLQQEIVGCSNRLGDVVGHKPRFFRPPFGQTSVEVKNFIHTASMQQVLWNANSQDSWLIRPSQILHWSLEETRNGSILLMHSKPATAAVLDRVLTALEKRGFRFVLPEAPPDAATFGPGK